MKKLLSKQLCVFSATLMLLSSAAFSQIDNVNFLRSAPADGVRFIEAYITPWANAFGAGLNGSWYNTAKPHKFGGFDITFGLNVGMVPSSAETFDISKAGFTALTGSGQAPTIAGPKSDGPTLNYVQNVAGTDYTLASFPAPPGTNWKYIPVPTLQLGIGLPLGTELKGRFIPRLPISDGDIMLWGVGLMHSIMQYIPGNKLSPFDVSIFGGYTWLNGNIPISLQPDPAISNYSTINPILFFADQNLAMTVQAYNVSALASVNLKVITFYGGLGYSNTSTTAELTGNFPTPVLNGTTVEYNDTPQSTTTGAEFPDIEIENFSGLRTNVGFRLKLAVITIHVDYTRSQYNVVSTGLGISFR